MAKNAGLFYDSLSFRYKYLTDEELRRDFKRFKDDGMTRLALMLHWSRIESDTQGVYYDDFLDEIKRVLLIANEFGLQVMVDLHMFWTPGWYTPSYVIDPTTGQERAGLAIVRSKEMYNAFIDMVRHTVNYLRGYPKWCYALNEPWYTPKQLSPPYENINQRENFIRLFQDFALICQTLDSRAFTVKFPSSHTFQKADGTWAIYNIFEDQWNWDQRIFDALDFISFDAYKPFDRPEIVDEWRNIVSYNIKETINRYGKKVWMSELGAKTDSDLIQAEQYADMVDFYVKSGASGTLGFYWCSDVAPPGWDQNPPFGGMNLANPDGTPRPAYYELLKFSPPTPISPIKLAVPILVLLGIGTVLYWLTLKR